MAIVTNRMARSGAFRDSGGAMDSYDLAVVGAGIVGLAHALIAARRGLRVCVIDRDAQANGASVRNFGFITVTGQERGEVWRRAKRSRDIWAEIARPAGIEVVQRGLLVLARRPEAMPVLEAFRDTEMGEACELLTPAEVRDQHPDLRPDTLTGAMFSPHELRVESRTAIPALARYLETGLGVTFRRQAQVREVAPPRVATTAGDIAADAVVVCPGDDFFSLYPDRIAAYGLTRCLLQMLRVRPLGDFALPCPVMSDLSLVRYAGYAALPEAEPLRALLEKEQAAELGHGIHLIAVGSADGSLVVGDSHRYAATPHPFSEDAIDDLMLREMTAATGLADYAVTERWIGTYASAGDRVMLMDTPADNVRLVIVTSGTGASTAFAIAEEVLTDMGIDG